MPSATPNQGEAQASEGHCVLTTLHCLVMKVELTSCGIANFCRVTSSIPYKATFCQLDTKVSIRLSSYIWTGFSSPQQELTLLTEIFLCGGATMTYSLYFESHQAFFFLWLIASAD